MSEWRAAGQHCELFRQAMKREGIATNAEIVADGKIHRFYAEGDKKGTKNGWYVIHSAPYPVGCFGSWKLGVTHAWQLSFPKRPGLKGRAELEKRIEETRAKQTAELERRQAKACDIAWHIWEGAQPAPVGHPYLKKKQIAPNGARFRYGCLVLPVHDVEGILRSVQFISPQGEKRFLSGGRVAGCFCAIGTRGKRLYIGEGFATCSTIHKVTGEAAFTAFSAGNLKAVAVALRERHPDAELVIAADDDRWTDGNPGRAKAIEAAKAARTKLVFPRFLDASTRPTDFNDLLLLQGAEEVRKQLEPTTGGNTSTASAHAQEAGGTDTEGSPPQWPDPPAEEAYYGLAGEIVRAIEPHTEASSVALLIQTLLCFGNVIGRTAHFVAEASQHFTNLFAVLVGVTSSGRKGSSWAQVLRLFRKVDPQWATRMIQSGLSTGEGLIWAVRDPVLKREPVKEKGRVVDYQEVETDAGISDKRLLAFESEFASPLRMMARDGNTLCVGMRQAWDTGELRTMTKNSPATATGAHISIMGHVTRDELRRELTSTDMGNGFANRILWMCTARSKELPEGGNLGDAELGPLAEKVKDAVAFARTIGEMKRHPAIKSMWAKTYHELTAGRPGLLGAVTSRAEAQTMRLACVYALLDESGSVRAEHLLAAVALWEYCAASARFIFGDALGDPTADAILQALRAVPEGLDRTAISSLFGRNKLATEITRALSVLQEHGLARVAQAPADGTGRPREVWTAVGCSTK